MMRRLVLTETATGTTYTAETSIPVGARITDVLIETFAAWTAGSIAVDVGDSDDPQALIAAYDLTGAAYSTAANGSGTAWGDSSGNGAPYSAALGVGTGKLYPSGDLITVVGTAGTPGGPTGLTYVTLLIEQASVVRQASVA